ncbi:MAG: glycine zipper domain-containing protein [Desulfurobacteriaceae bacterium]
MKSLKSLLLGVSLLTAVSGCTSTQLSKQDAALLGALGGAAVGAATHKHYKASAKDAAIYGAIAGGIIGYVVGSDQENRHTVKADTEYDVKTKDGKVIHVREGWYTVDSQPAPTAK